MNKEELKQGILNIISNYTHNIGEFIYIPVDHIQSICDEISDKYDILDDIVNDILDWQVESDGLDEFIPEENFEHIITQIIELF